MPEGSTDLDPRHELPLVLIIEDDPVEGDSLAEILGGRYRVEVVGDGDQGLARAVEVVPALVLSDLKAPGLCGERLIEDLHARSTTRDVPVLVLASGEEEILRMATLAGNSWDFLTKPIVATELLTRAARLVAAGSRARSELRIGAGMLGRFVERLPLPLGYIDRNGVTAYLNDCFVELFGYSKVDVPTLDAWLQVAYPDEAYRRQVRSMWTVAVEEAAHMGGRIGPVEVSVTCKNGRVLVVEISGVSVDDGILASFVDRTEKRRAEEALERLSQQRQLSLDAARLGWWVYDPTIGVASYDARYREIFGLPGERLSIDEMLDRLHPDDVAEVWARVEAALGRVDSEPYSIEFRVIQDDGSLRWVVSHGLAEVEVDGPGRRAARLVGTVEDITERKRMESQLRETADRYRLATTSGRVVTWEAGEDAAISRLDPTFWEWVRIGEAGVPADLKGWIAWHHPDDRESVAAAILGAFEGRSDEIFFEFRATLCDGHLGWFQCRGRVERGEGGRPIGAVGSIIDITSRKRAEERRHESDERYRLALDGAGLGTWDWHLPSGRLDYDARWAGMLGYRPEELGGHIQAWEDLLHPDDAPSVRESVKEHLDGFSPEFTAEYRLRRKDGSWAWIFDVGKVIARDALGRPLRLCGVHQDITARRSAEEARRESERLARSVLDSLRTSIAVLDETGDILAVNRSWRDFACENGLFGDACDGRNYLQVCDAATGEDAAQAADFAAGIRDVLAGRRPMFEMEYPCHSPSARRWFIGRVTPFVEGGPSRAVVAHSEVTSLKLAELSLRESEERFRTVVESVPAGLIVVDAAGLITMVNGRFVDWLGYERDELIGKSIDMLVPESARGHHEQLRGQFTASPFRMDMGHGRELNAVRKDGSEFPVEIGLNLVQTDSGPMVLAAVMDATERRRADQAIRALNAELERQAAAQAADVHKLARIIDSSTDYIATATPEGVPMWENEAFRRILGIRPVTEGLPRSIKDYHPPESSARIIQEGIPTAVREGHWLGETEVLTAAGRARPVSQLILAHRGNDGGVAFFSTIMRDITERKEMEEALRQRSEELTRTNLELTHASRLKDEFLASMSHELRTPLSAVLALSESLVEGVYGAMTDEQVSVIRDVEKSGRHLMGLINDILDLSKAEAGQIRLDPIPTSIDSICQGSIRLVRQAAQSRNLRLSCATDGGADSILADELRLKQILVNLLSNAVKFTPEGGAVGLDVKADKASRSLTFTVWDTGIGIREEDMKILFQPFRQIDSRLSRQYTGTGLGLALVEKLTALHHGVVSVESEPGRGSRFIVTIPWEPFDEPEEYDPGRATASPPLEARPTRSAGLASGEAAGEAPEPEPPLILLADDDELNRKLISDVLVAAGYRVSQARDGEEAIRMASTLQPRLVLMDIQMPGIDGLEAIRVLRSAPETRTLPIVALTALAMSGDRERCLDAGADAYLSKPMTLRELRRVVAELV
ncbi:PAS domain S-box protein [Aquisphaera insulae]|uniref:PAS domain S-box protein n=1 Tax=Aquisphaera insulae TaxID=2712864 RepID=UPI0013EBB498|nr:PAS domain S-box protein [Aquisphaera insulae]